jgi:hypothetical protein
MDLGKIHGFFSGKMSPGIFPHTCGREKGSMDGLPPGLGSVIVLTYYTTPRVHDRVELGEGILALVCFEQSGPWWFGTGFSDNVNPMPIITATRIPANGSSNSFLRYAYAAITVYLISSSMKEEKKENPRLLNKILFATLYSLFSGLKPNCSAVYFTMKEGITVISDIINETTRMLESLELSLFLKAVTT